MAVKRDAADIWFSKAVRARDGKCLHTGRTDALECAHIYGRRAKILRWSLDNAVSLTHASHRYFTENPVAFHDWLEQTLGEGHMAILREKARGHMKTNAQLRREIAKHYREELKKLEENPDYKLISFN
tara:strand:+ start:406 stop:789 length:384 start_codon:yes stop_codon:yes gene_type:complete